MSVIAWQQPMWGSVLQQLTGGGAPPAAGSTFAFFTTLDSPITSGAYYKAVPGIFSAPDGQNKFVAPFDMVLKTFSERITLGTGYRADTKFAYRINGGSIIDMVTILAGTTGKRVHTVDVAISAGDEVELLYNCGNNFSMSVGLGFYFEATDPADRTSGSFYVMQYDTGIATRETPTYYGDFGSYNVAPCAPVSMVIRRMALGVIGMAEDCTFYIIDNGGNTIPLGTVLSGETSATFDNIDLPVIRGERMPIIYSSAPTTSQPGFSFVMECQIAGFSGKPNQGILVFTDDDANVAQAWHYGYIVPTTNGVIKEAYINPPFNYGSVTINVEINGVDTAIFSGALSKNVLNTQLPNIGFSAGDEIRVKHNGTGLTGGGLDITLLLETPYGGAYESPVWSAPVGPVLGGDERTWNMDNYTASTSSNASKGNIYMFKEDRLLTKIRADSNTTSQTYKFMVLELDDNYDIVSIMYDGATFSTTTGYQEQVLPTPLLLEANKLYGIVTVRTDVAQVRMDYDRSPIFTDPSLLALPMGMIIRADFAFAVSDNVWLNKRDEWDMGITTEAVSDEGKFRYWSILMQGSDDGTAHSIAEIEFRALPGGANIITDDGQLYASSADDLASIPNLIDADNSTVWEITDANFDADDRRIVISVPPNTVQEIVITSDSGADFGKTPTDWKLQFSEDGLLWNDAFTVSGEAAWSAGETRTYTRPQPTDDSLSGHRYWAVLCADNTDSQGYIGIAKLEMRETANGSDIATTGNAISGSERVGFEATLAFDADPATKWSCDFAVAKKNERWLGQDFGAGNETVINEVVITARNDGFHAQCVTNGAVVYSDDGTTWKIAWIFGNTTAWTSGESRTFTRP